MPAASITSTTSSTKIPTLSTITNPRLVIAIPALALGWTSPEFPEFGIELVSLTPGHTPDQARPIRKKPTLIGELTP